MRLKETIAEMEREKNAQNKSGSLSPLSRRSKSTSSPIGQSLPSRPAGATKTTDNKSTAYRLWDENSSLKRQLASAKALIGRLHAAVAKAQAQVVELTTRNSKSTSISVGDGGHKMVKVHELAAIAADSTLSEDDYMDAEDAEIAALISRNANNLKEIRQDLKEAENEIMRASRFELESNIRNNFSSAFPRDFTSHASSLESGRNLRERRHLDRPSTAGPRIRPALNLADAGGRKETRVAGNLIGRSLKSANDVKDAKAAIRKAQLEMQRLRNARAAMEKAEDEEEEGASNNTEVRIVPPILDSQKTKVGTKQRLPGRLAGVPEIIEVGSSPVPTSDGSPMLSRRSDTEETRVRDEERRQILFYNDGELQ